MPGSDRLFVSGSSHQLLQLGQALAAGPPQSAGTKRKLSTASHNKQRQPSEDPSPLASPPGHAGSTKGKGSGSSVTVLDMIEAGLLQPGEQNTTVTYKGTTHTASLQRNGTIMFRGTEFTTPSAFSVYVKRLTTPNKQGDDGWHSVHVNGVSLHTTRLQYQAAQQQQQQQQQQQSSPGGGQSKPVPHTKQAAQQQFQQAAQQHKKQGKPKPVLKLHVKLKPSSRHPGPPGGGVTAAGQQAPGGSSAAKQQVTPQQQQQEVKQAAGGLPRKAGPPGAQPGMRWVQCSRCEVWRSVAEDDWPQVESESGSTWFCEDATWELTRREPFTPACLSDLWTGAEGGEGPQ